MNKAHIIEALDRFIRQRPGLNPSLYGSQASYRAEVRSVAQDLKHARALLQSVASRDSIDAESILAAFPSKLQLVGDRIEYETGSHFATAYRRTVAAMCAQLLWDNYRAHYADATTAADIRRIATRELGRGIAQRWFR